MKADLATGVVDKVHALNDAGELEIRLPHELSLRQYQQPLWNAIIHEGFRRAIVVWPRRNGKDLITLNLLIAEAFRRVGLYFYIAPFYTQVRSIIWNGTDGAGRRFLDYIPTQLIKKRNESELKIELINGSILRFLGSDNIDSIVGNNPIGIAFTEFSLHKPTVWDYLRPVLAENRGWAIFNGTPRGLNNFYQLFESAKRSEGWFVQHLTRDITGIPSLESIEEDRKSGMPESLIQQEYYCSWNASSEETLIPLDIIQPAIQPLSGCPDINEPRIMGVDVAYAAKGDMSVIAKRQGRILHPLKRFQGVDNMSLATRIAQEIEDWGPKLVFIDSGRGEGVISRLHQLGYSNLVSPVHFSGKPFSDLYANKRAEIWCRCRDWFLRVNEGMPPCIPDDKDLIADLSAPRFEINDRGFIQLESKKSIIKRGYKSTDDGDAIALTFSEDEEVLKRAPEFTTVDREQGTYWGQNLEEFRGSRIPRTRTYDPLNMMNGHGYDYTSPAR